MISYLPTVAQQLPPGTDANAKSSALAGPIRLASTLGPRSSPFQPPKGNDHSFFTDAGASLDTGCLFRSQGPITFTVKVTRVVGDVSADGTLVDAASLVSAGLLSKTVKLIMPAFDVDSEAVLPPPFQPEVDVLSFNGERIGTLKGVNDTWKLNSFEIPVEKVRFAQKGAAGSDPTPGENEVKIDIDTGNAPLGAELWCTSIDWGSMGFKAMSPILLIHGNNSDGGFFDRRGFTGELKKQHLLFDNSINMQTSSIATNASTLDSKIPDIVKSFGVDSIHLVVHSKGGLDSRGYLADYQSGHDSTFKVLSYTSLSTPHNGSAGADLLVAREQAAAVTSNIEFKGFPTFTETVADAMTVDVGTRNLTTTFVQGFNTSNVPRLPASVVFNTVAADADLNGNAQIDRSPDEYLELRQESPALTATDNSTFGHTKSRIAINAVYQVMRTSSTTQLTFRTEKTFFGGTRTIAVLTNVPNPTSLGNDTLVTIPSGQGVGSVQSRTTNTAVFNGTNGRNHSNVANAGVAQRVIPWIISVEKSSGDLK